MTPTQYRLGVRTLYRCVRQRKKDPMTRIEAREFLKGISNRDLISGLGEFKFYYNPFNRKIYGKKDMRTLIGKAA